VLASDAAAQSVCAAHAAHSCACVPLLPITLPLSQGRRVAVCQGGVGGT
jgi:hypothetical protein